LFADKAFANTVKYGGKTEVYTPIYKYDINYLPGSGEFVFVRGSGSSMGDFNPAVLASPVSANAGSQVTVTETFKYVFEHADSFTQLASADRFAAMNKNTYAIGSTNFDQNMPLSADFSNNSAGWVRPYTSFESMHLNKGPKVDVVAYGSLVGYDTDFKHLKRGWSSVGTGYIGYNGSQLRYSGSSTTMNGGLLGFTETLYKGNFWTALTLSAGASVGETHTGYGKEDFTSLSAGVGSKTGYNFEFKEGKFIIQPVWFMSYTFVNTFDYKTAAGVQIDNDPSHTIQLNPSIRFIGNSKNGWQPYASVGMVWNLLNKSGSTANGVKLPETYVKPYVEYGVGLQKRWADKYSAFLQAMLRNGGRNGVSLTAGFRWSLGKEGKPIEKVSNPQNRQSVDTNRKVIKKTS
jgi:outer membrane autotransporter protein